MKKALVSTLAASLLLLSLVGCGAKDNPTTDYGADGSADKGMSGAINVISREDGSGTRGAFVELFGIEEKDADGKKVDMTMDAAEITNNTSVMMTSVAGNPEAIGYISLGSLNDDVKALKIDGVAPSAAGVKDGSYTVSRPFNLATKENLSPAAKDFLTFIMSKEGQDVVEEEGYVRVADTGAYSGTQAAGKVSVAGSSSVSPVMKALAAAYKTVNPAAEVEIQESDSTTGVNSLVDGICDIGMASRALKDSEIEKGLKVSVIAMDGIVVIVNKNNTTEGLSSEQVKGIYTGELSDWADVQ